MARDRGQVNRMLMGVRFSALGREGKAPAQPWSDTFLPGSRLGGSLALPSGTASAVAGEGGKLFRGSEEVGQVTSSVLSPRLNAVIAFAYLRRGSWDPGTELTTTDGLAAVVCSLPFLPVSVLP